MAINGIEMITDRSQSDIVIAKSLFRKGFNGMTDAEKSAFLAGLRGAYNYTDFNRVESAVEYLSKRLYNIPSEIEALAEQLGVAPDSLLMAGFEGEKYADVEVKTDWTANDYLTGNDRNRYLQNLLLILSGFQDTSKIPTTLSGLTYLGANNIEKSLEGLNSYLINLQETKETLINKTSKAWFFSGELFGGET